MVVYVISGASPVLPGSPRFSPVVPGSPPVLPGSPRLSPVLPGSPVPLAPFRSTSCQFAPFCPTSTNFAPCRPVLGNFDQIRAALPNFVPCRPAVSHFDQVCAVLPHFDQLCAMSARAVPLRPSLRRVVPFLHHGQFAAALCPGAREKLRAQLPRRPPHVHFRVFCWCSPPKGVVLVFPPPEGFFGVHSTFPQIAKDTLQIP